MKKLLLIFLLSTRIGCFGLEYLDNDFLSDETDQDYMKYRCEQIQKSAQKLEEMVENMCPLDPIRELLEDEIALIKFMIGTSE